MDSLQNETYLIDRIPAINLFREVMVRKRPERALRIFGTTKMGKSRLMREYRKIAESEYRARCALIDLRSRLQNYGDFLYAIGEQIGASYFPNFASAQNEIAGHNKIEVSKVLQLFSKLSAQTEQDEAALGHQRRKLTQAFLTDLKLMPSDLPIVLLFDAFEQADDSTQAWLNEQLMIGLRRVEHVIVVFAGIELPKPSPIWNDIAYSYELQPVSLEEHKQYCEHLGMELNDETSRIIEAFHNVFEGIPGLFAEYASKLVTER